MDLSSVHLLSCLRSSLLFELFVRINDKSSTAALGALYCVAQLACIYACTTSGICSRLFLVPFWRIQRWSLCLECARLAQLAVRLLLYHVPCRPPGFDFTRHLHRVRSLSKHRPARCHRGPRKNRRRRSPAPQSGKSLPRPYSVILHCTYPSEHMFPFPCTLSFSPNPS